MAEPEFSPAVSKALDAYVVPDMPAGFTDRLIARIESGDGIAATVPSIAGRFRKRGLSGGNAWRRSGRILGSVAAISLMAATAAAAGIFGDPVYMPGISEVLAKTELVPLQRNITKSKPLVVAVNPTKQPAAETLEAPVTGAQAVIARVAKMRADPAFSNLTPRERLAIARKEVQTMIRSGEVTRQEARAAVRDLARSADPATRAQVRATIKARREARLERTGRVGPIARNDSPVTDASPPAGPADPADDNAVSEKSLAVAESIAAPEQIGELREKYREATPEQRTQIRQALRERRAVRQQRRPR